MKSNISQGQVIKGVGGEYTVNLDSGELISCAARGKIRLNDIICIGDIVNVEKYTNGKGAIQKIMPRKNKLVRPYVSNLDAIVITVAITPIADFALVDKMLIHCLQQDVQPILCVNKIDITPRDYIQEIHNDYDGLCDVVEVSALTSEGIPDLLSKIVDKFVCFSGQSAVGKSSIINSIIGHNQLQVGELSQKIERGKHCTRTVEIFEPQEGIKIADTCGFSTLEMPQLDPRELAGYFVDFDECATQCKFRGCTHTTEPDCGVRVAVEKSEISQKRYQRYLKLYEVCQAQWRRRYE